MASWLPVEVITHIMKYLSVADIKEASLVNRAWYEASLDPVIQRSVRVTMLSQTGSRPMSRLQRRRTPHLTLNDVDGSFLSNNFALKTFAEIGDSLQSLSLKGSNITEKTFMSIIACCTALTDLDLATCNSLFMSGNLLASEKDCQTLKPALKKLKSLNLSGIRYLSDATFSRLVSVCENLVKLSVASCQIVFMVNTYYPVNRSHQKDSSAVFTFLSVLKLLQSRPSKLKSLDFSRTGLDDDALRTLSGVKDLMLDELLLVSCKEISDTGVAALCSNQKGLKTLDLAFCTDVTSSATMAISKHCTKMERLCLDSCKQITGQAVKEFHSLGSLVELNLSGCYQLSSAGIQQGLCSQTLPQLKSLNLNACSLMTDKCVVAICNHLSQLEHLDLGSCFHITNISVQAIAKHLVLLRSLRLAFCKEIDGFGICGLVEECDGKNGGHDEMHHGKCRCTRHNGDVPVFQYPLINIEKKTKQLSVEEIDALTKERTGPVYTLRVIKGLRTLDMKGCPKLTSSAIIHAIQFTELRVLDLSMCMDIDDDTLYALSLNNPSIEELSLAKCALITDVGITHMASHLRRLTSLNISSCDQITDKGLQSLLKCHNLRQLDVSLCGYVTLSSIGLLEQKLPYLRNIKMRYIGTLVKTSPNSQSQA